MNVLLFEDDPALSQMITRTVKSTFGDNTVVSVVDTPAKIEGFSVDNLNDLDIILMTTRLRNGVITFALAHRISGAFKGTIVAVSSDGFYHREMLRLGCTHACEKAELLSILGSLGK